MPKVPPRDDEESEYQETISPTQRRRRAAMSRQPAKEYYSDEHPEIPKIKRASLRLQQAEEKADTLPPPQSKPRSANRAPRKKIVDLEEDLQSEEAQYSSKKIVVSPPTRSTVYQPPPAPRTRHIQRRHPVRAFFIRLSHNQSFLIGASVLLVMLILGPIVINAIVLNSRQNQTTSSTNINSTGTNGSTTGIQLPSSVDPRELVITPPENDHPAPPVLATSAYLLDADTGATYYAYNPFMHLPMLSTTKLMTAVLAVELGDPGQKTTKHTQHNHDISQLSADSSLFNIKKGETYTLREMLYGLLLVSGNDAAIAIADTISGNQQTFVAKMNQRAVQMGLNDTHYMNPHGLLDTGQFSSAHDLAVLGRYSMSLPLFQQISSTQLYHIPAGGNHPARDVLNGNQFLWWYPGVNGGKPGWDGANNFVQVISCVRNHHHLIGVVMHTSDWWTDMRNLMNWGFDSFSWISPYDVDFQHPIPYDFLWNYFAKDKKETTIPTADKGRYYIYTGFSVSGSILAYYDNGGGLAKFGYPTGMPGISKTQYISQSFEHGTIQCDLTGKQCTTF